MIVQCPYCQKNTAGQHEYGCPNATPLTQIVIPDEYVWKDGHRYRLVLDDPPHYWSDGTNIRTRDDFDAQVEIQWHGNIVA